MALSDLGARIAAAAHLDPITRARALRDLARDARSVLAAEIDRAIHEACETHTYSDVASALGISSAEVNRRISEHRRRAGRGQPDRRGRRRAITMARPESE